ncbi:MAG: fibronectin type III domain-containing protein [Bacteroidota bacterium]
MKHTKNSFLKFSAIFLSLFLLVACDDKDELGSTAPGPVTELTAITSAGSVDLSWIEPGDEDLARIEISYTPDPEQMIYSQTAGLNGMTLSGLTNGTEYEFSVLAVDEDGNKSDTAKVIAFPNNPLVVESPDQNDYQTWGGDTYSTDGSGHLVITVTFNRPVDPATVIPGQTIYFQGDAISTGTVAFSRGNKIMTYTTAELAGDIGDWSGSNLYFDFVLVGEDSGNGVITDANGMTLDGDENGAPGGNYILTDLYIIG